MKYKIQFLLWLGLLLACGNASERGSTELPEDSFLVKITISAGQTDQPSFLPYLGNYGQLEMDENTAILVLSKSVKPGTQMPVRPLGTLVFKENQLTKNVIIATPIDSLQKLSQVANFQEFIIENVGEKQIVQDWFLYQKGLGKRELIGWKDERYAWSLIRKKKL